LKRMAFPLVGIRAKPEHSYECHLQYINAFNYILQDFFMFEAQGKAIKGFLWAFFIEAPKLLEVSNVQTRWISE